MKLVDFPERNIEIAKDQDEYLTIPAHAYKDTTGTVCFCWKLSILERIRLLFSGVLWHQVYTFYKPLQPVRLQIDKPKMRRLEAVK